MSQPRGLEPVGPAIDGGHNTVITLHVERLDRRLGGRIALVRVRVVDGDGLARSARLGPRGVARLQDLLRRAADDAWGDEAAEADDEPTDRAPVRPEPTPRRVGVPRGRVSP